MWRPSCSSASKLSELGSFFTRTPVSTGESDHQLSLFSLCKNFYSGLQLAAKSLPALLLFPPPSITSLLFFLNPLHVSSPFPPPSLLLQCNLRPCLIDGWMMKVAGGGMVVPCFLLLWWRRFQQTEILPLLLLFLRFFSCHTILCYFLFSSFISRSGSSLFHIHVSKGLFRTKIDQRKSPSTSTIISRRWKLLSVFGSGFHPHCCFSLNGHQIYLRS